MRVAGLGDCALSLLGAAGIFAAHQPEVSHELPGMLEAMDVSKLADGNQRRNEPKPLRPSGVTAGLSRQSWSRLTFFFATGSPLVGALIAIR